MPVGLALGNIALGPAIGLIIGAVIGNYYEKKYEKAGRLRPLTKKEKRIQKRNAWWVLGVGVVVLIGVLVGYLFFN
jgi:uncharacterized protein YneF (UPF0154 family)